MPLAQSAINDRVTYHPPTEEAKKRHEAVRGDFTALMSSLNAQLPDSRETSLVMTKLEEALFWANAAIARNHDKL